jgi:hypothetical protein
LQRLKGLIERGLSATATLWPTIRLAFNGVHQAAPSLGVEGIDQETVKQRSSGLLGAMARHQDKVGEWAPAVDHFRKVSRSYWPGLFPC